MSLKGSFSALLRMTRKGGQRTLVSVLSFYQSRRLAIDRSVVGFARPQIEFVDANLEKRGSRHGKNHSEQPEHCPRRKCEEQDVDRVQPHLFAEHARNKEV